MIHDGGVSAPIPTGKPNARMGQTVSDMVLSLAIVLGVIGAIMLVTWRPTPDPVREIDPIPLLAFANSQADFPVLVPQIAGLRATSARWEPTKYSQNDPVWHVGYVTAEEEYLEITQSAASNEEYVDWPGGENTYRLEESAGRIGPKNSITKSSLIVILDSSVKIYSFK